MENTTPPWYLAGPMTGLPDYNYPQFEAAKRDLEAIEFRILSPHEIDFGETFETRGKTKHYSEYMREALKLLLQCQGIILLPNWTLSRGAMLEFTIANSLGMGAMQYSPEDGGLAVLL